MRQYCDWSADQKVIDKRAEKARAVAGSWQLWRSPLYLIRDITLGELHQHLRLSGSVGYPWRVNLEESAERRG